MKAGPGGLPRDRAAVCRLGPIRGPRGRLSARERAVQSAKSFSHEAGLLTTFMKECDGLAYDPSDWCAGMGHDVEWNQFEQSWTAANPCKTWVQLPDEQTAR